MPGNATPALVCYKVIILDAPLGGGCAGEKAFFEVSFSTKGKTLASVVKSLGIDRFFHYQNVVFWKAALTKTSLLIQSVEEVS